MEQRKVISLGRSSLVISLPRHWMKLNDLKKGDIVSLDIQRNRSLVIFPNAEREKKVRDISLYIDPNEKGVSIVRRIIACYLNGYSSIKLNSKTAFSSAQQKAIREIARSKIYMRIMESDSKSMVLQTLIDESKASFVSGIHRMYIISSSICQDSLNSLRDNNIDLAKTISSLDDDVDHFCFFLLRLLRSATIDPELENRLDLDPMDCLNYQFLIYKIEYVSDYAVNIANNVTILCERKQRIPDSILNLILDSGRESVTTYDMAVQAFFSKDISVCEDVLERQEMIREIDQKIASLTYTMKDLDHSTIHSICSLRLSIQNIVQYAKRIAEVAIDRFYEEKST